jgi:hypothetical protein
MYNTHSEEIKELVAALVKVQSILKPANFNKVNPHFKSRYADFASCMDACRIPLAENGIAVVQYCQSTDGKLNLVTMLAHVSGQWMKSEFPIISTKMDSQGIGSAMTYAKRYSLSGMIGIVADDEDDDGETAVGRAAKAAKTAKPEDPKEYIDKFIAYFEKEDRPNAMEYLKIVQKHFEWDSIQAVKELLKDESKLFEKFNAWKSKLKKPEEV